MTYKRKQEIVRSIKNVEFLKNYPKLVTKNGMGFKLNVKESVLDEIITNYNRFKDNDFIIKIVTELNSNGIVKFRNKFNFGDLKNILNSIKNSTKSDYRLLYEFDTVSKDGTGRILQYTNLDDATEYIDEYRENINDMSIIKDITISVIDVPDRLIKSGAFFPYMNTSNIDLTRYGIYKTGHSSDEESCCFIDSISSQLDNDTINDIKMLIQRRDVTRSDITYVCKELGLGCNIHYYDESGKERCILIGSKNSVFVMDIGLIYDHYFIFEITNMTMTYLKNMELISGLDTMVGQVDWVGDKYYIKKKNTKPMNSLKLIKTLYDMGYFKPIGLDVMIDKNLSYKNTDIYEYVFDYVDTSKSSLDLYKFKESKTSGKFLPKTVFSKKYNKEYTFVSPSLNIQSWISEKSSDDKAELRIRPIFFSDFESCVVNNDRDNLPIHKPYLWVLTGIGEGSVMHSCFNKDVNYLIMEFLECLLSRVRVLNSGPPIVYFHNMKYDMSFFISYLCNLSVCEKNGNIYMLKGRYKYMEIEFRDSYKMLSEPLKKFSTMFNIIGIEKDIYPYDYYTPERVDIMDIDYVEKMDMRTYLKNDEDYNVFIKSEFRPVQYALKYCIQDVNILKTGMIEFNKRCESALKLSSFNSNMFDYLTISSLSSVYLAQCGVYDGVRSVDSILQLFINESVKGGRCMSMRNSKVDVCGPIQDLDANSLYPSSMSVIKGYPIGNPSVINCDFDVHTDNLYFIRIQLLEHFYEHEFDYDFPLFWDDVERLEEIIDINGNLTTVPMKQQLYVNKPNNRNFILDSVTMQECMSMYNMKLNQDFKVITGVVYDGGYNDKICDVIKDLYNTRKTYQKENNPLESVFKLIMNSGYGKSILRSSKTECKVYNLSNEQDAYKSYIYNHYNNIASIEEFSNYTGHKCAIIKKYISSKTTHKNYAQCGSYVLAMSKKIMNNVFRIAHKNRLPIYYQDTDSVHLRDEHVKYFSHLIGDSLGEFSSDFKGKNLRGRIHSNRLIVVGKKMYIDEMEDEFGNKEIHVRMKGIPEANLMKHCVDNNIDCISLYESLYDGHSVKIDLLNDVNIKRFAYKGFCVGSINKFERTIRCTTHS